MRPPDEEVTPPDRPLRLLIVTHSLGGGGAERFAVTLAGRLDPRLFTPALATAIDRVDYPPPPGVPVMRLGYRGAGDLPLAVAALRDVIDETRPDLVLSNVLATNCLTGAALAALAAVPGAPTPAWAARVGNAPERDPWFQGLWARVAYRRARTLVCNARGMVAAFERAYPGARGRVESVGNPVDFAALDLLAGEVAAAGGSADLTAGEPLESATGLPGDRSGAVGSPILLAVGRLTRQKRPDLMVEALARVRRRPGLAAARLVLCGEGPIAGNVEAAAHAAGLAGAVDLLGFVANPFALMRRADLYLLTSDHEGLPNTLIEAQGLGLPAVATRCPYGPDEIVEDGVTGRLVPTGDAEAIAAAAADLLADPERRRRMGEAAASRARRLYDVAVLVPEWERLLLAATGNPV